jgi:hypothetical protein
MEVHTEREPNFQTLLLVKPLATLGSRHLTPLTSAMQSVIQIKILFRPTNN